MTDPGTVRDIPPLGLRVEVRHSDADLLESYAQAGGRAQHAAMA